MDFIMKSLRTYYRVTLTFLTDILLISFPGYYGTSYGFPSHLVSDAGCRRRRRRCPMSLSRVAFLEGHANGHGGVLTRRHGVAPALLVTEWRLPLAPIDQSVVLFVCTEKGITFTRSQYCTARFVLYNTYHSHHTLTCTAERPRKVVIVPRAYRLDSCLHHLAKLEVLLGLCGRNGANLSKAQPTLLQRPYRTVNHIDAIAPSTYQYLPILTSLRAFAFISSSVVTCSFSLRMSSARLAE